MMNADERAAVEAVHRDPKVQALLAAPPRAPRGRWPRVRRAARAALQLIGVLAFALALYTNHNQASIGQCVNDTLASRLAPVPGVPSDAQAHIDFARSLDSMLQAAETDQPAKARAFKLEVQDYVRDLSANQTARDAHPLGKC